MNIVPTTLVTALYSAFQQVGYPYYEVRSIVSDIKYLGIVQNIITDKNAETVTNIHEYVEEHQLGTSIKLFITGMIMECRSKNDFRDAQDYHYAYSMLDIAELIDIDITHVFYILRDDLKLLSSERIVELCRVVNSPSLYRTAVSARPDLENELVHMRLKNDTY